MNFISIMKGIGKGLAVAADVAGVSVGAAAPIVSVFNPAAGAILQKIGTLVTGVETMVTSSKQGAFKKQTVSQIALAELPLLNEVIRQFGPNVKIPAAELSAAIDASVANYNAIAALIAVVEKQNAVLPVQTAQPVDN